VFTCGPLQEKVLNKTGIICSVKTLDEIIGILLASLSHIRTWMISAPVAEGRGPLTTGAPLNPTLEVMTFKKKKKQKKKKVNKHLKTVHFNCGWNACPPFLSLRRNGTLCYADV
jgi:hypothetical protein